MNALADLPLWASLPAALLLISGGILTLLGSLGLLRLDDFFARVHAPTMGSTLGTYCVLTASMLVSSALSARPVIHELLIALLILITAPVTTMILMSAAIRRGKSRVDISTSTGSATSESSSAGSDVRL